MFFTVSKKIRIQISKKDIRTADHRLKRVHARLMEEKRYAKKQPQAARDKGKRI